MSQILSEFENLAMPTKKYVKKLIVIQTDNSAIDIRNGIN